MSLNSLGRGKIIQQNVTEISVKLSLGYFFHSFKVSRVKTLYEVTQCYQNKLMRILLKVTEIFKLLDLNI